MEAVLDEHAYWDGQPSVFAKDARPHEAAVREAAKLDAGVPTADDGFRFRVRKSVKVKAMLTTDQPGARSDVVDSQLSV